LQIAQIESAILELLSQESLQIATSFRSDFRQQQQQHHRSSNFRKTSLAAF